MTDSCCEVILSSLSESSEGYGYVGMGLFVFAAGAVAQLVKRQEKRSFEDVQLN